MSSKHQEKRPASVGTHDPAPCSGDNLKRPVSVLRFFTAELTRGYLLEREEEKYAQKRQRVYTFMKTPRELEKFSTYGFFQCVDAFLFIFTFLPLRILLAVLKVLTAPCGFMRSKNLLEPAQICDILKGIVLTVCCFIMMHIDTSMMYHLVRGQATIKLYVFFNMLDMADRLLSNFGHDILDALFWTATEPRGRRRDHLGTLPHLVIAIIYVILHTMLILFQATVLNVAFNSHNKSLLVIMMSNNFVEIKTNLFKKVDVNHLYQIACSDVKERFHYVLLLTVVCIRNMTEVSWNFDHLWVLLPDAMMVLVSEILVDWGKHAFILKFNEIPADVYRDYKVKLAVDMANSRQNQAFTDHSDLVSRRMGLTPLPLACLLFRILTKSVKLSSWMSYSIVFVLYLCLISFKILNSIVLLGHSYKVIESSRSEKHSESSQSSSPSPSEEREMEEVPEAGLIANSTPSAESTLLRTSSDTNVTRNFSEIYNADSYTELTFLPNTNVIEQTGGINFVPAANSESGDLSSIQNIGSNANDNNSKQVSHTSDVAVQNSENTHLQSHDTHDSETKSDKAISESHDLNSKSHDIASNSHDKDSKSHETYLKSGDQLYNSNEETPVSEVQQNSVNCLELAHSDDGSQSLPNELSEPGDSPLEQRNQQRFFISFGTPRRRGSSSSLPDTIGFTSDNGNQENGNQESGNQNETARNGSVEKEEKVE